MFYVLAISLLATCVCSQICFNLSAATLPPGGGLFFGLSPQGVADDPVQGTLFFSGRWLLREVVPHGPIGSSLASTSDAATSTLVRAMSSAQRTAMDPSSKSLWAKSTLENLQLPRYNFTTLRVLDNAIPPYLRNESYDHIGDADFILDTQQIIVPLEEPTYTRPKFVLYNRTNDSFVAVASYNATQHHCPWVAFADFSNTGGPVLVISSEFDAVASIYSYTWPSMVPFAKINLQLIGASGVMHVQGGVVRQGILYLSTDQNSNPHGHNLFAFDLLAVIHAEQPQASLLWSMKQTVLGGLAEIEGLTIDASSKLWLATNFLQLDSTVYTLDHC